MIWPDCDAPGLTYALDVERELTAVGAGIVTVIDVMRVAALLPDGESRQPPEGWDAADGLDVDGWEPQRSQWRCCSMSTEPSQRRATDLSSRSR